MSRFEGCKCLCQVLLLLLLFPCCREDGCLEAELEDVLQPHEVAAVAAVGPGGAPAFVLQVCVCLGLCRDMSRCVCVCVVVSVVWGPGRTSQQPSKQASDTFQKPILREPGLCSWPLPPATGYQ